MHVSRKCVGVRLTVVHFFFTIFAKKTLWVPNGLLYKLFSLLYYLSLYMFLIIMHVAIKIYHLSFCTYAGTLYGQQAVLKYFGHYFSNITRFSFYFFPGFLAILILTLIDPLNFIFIVIILITYSQSFIIKTYSLSFILIHNWIQLFKVKVEILSTWPARFGAKDNNKNCKSKIKLEIIWRYSLGHCGTVLIVGSNNTEKNNG